MTGGRSGPMGCLNSWKSSIPRTPAWVKNKNSMLLSLKESKTTRVRERKREKKNQDVYFKKIIYSSVVLQTETWCLFLRGVLLKERFVTVRSPRNGPQKSVWSNVSLLPHTHSYNLEFCCLVVLYMNGCLGATSSSTTLSSLHLMHRDKVRLCDH